MMKRGTLAYGILGLLILCVQSIKSQVILQDTLPMVEIFAGETAMPCTFLIDNLELVNHRGLSDLGELIERTTAIQIRGNGPGGSTGIAMRGGSTQQVECYWQGMSINSPSLGGLDLSLVPIELFSQALVQRGSSSLVPGAGGASGALHLSTSGLDGPASLSLHSSWTPHLQASRHAFILTHKEKNLAFRTGFSRTKAENDFPFIDDSGLKDQVRRRENADFHRTAFAQTIEWKLTDKSLLDVNTHLIGANRGIASPIGIPNKNERQRDEVGRILVRYRFFGGQISHEYALGHGDEQQHYLNPQALIDSRVHTKRSHVRAQFRWDKNKRNSVLLRIEGENSGLQLQDNLKKNQNRLAAFVGLNHQFKKENSLDLGLRWEPTLSGLFPIAFNIGTEFLLDKKARYKWVTSLSRNLRAPTLNDRFWPELGDDNLKPEQGYSAQMGLRLQGLKVQSTSTFFIHEHRDLLLWQPGVDGRFRPINLGEARSVGFEQDLSLTLTPSLLTELGYTYTHARTREEANQPWTRLTYRPSHQLSGSLVQNFSSFKWGLYGKYIAEQVTDLRKQPEYLHAVVLVDLEISYQGAWEPKNHWALGLRMNNVLDRPYEYIKDRPNPGRNITIFFNLNINEKQ